MSRRPALPHGRSGFPLRTLWLATAALAFGCSAAGRTPEVEPGISPPADQIPTFTENGELERPENWEAWVMVGTSTGLSYNEAVNAQPGAGPDMFHNVYLQPWAYRRFVETGLFPENTMFVLAFYEAAQSAAPARSGYYTGDLLPIFEVHVKRRGLHTTGWGFFAFPRDRQSASMTPGEASCYSCHASQADHDNVFVQFYPALRKRLAGAEGTPGA